MKYSIIETIRKIPLNSAQKRLHDLMASEMVHEAEEALRKNSTSAFHRLEKSVTQLIQLVSNPLLLASDIAFRHDQLLGEVIAEGPPPKVAAACVLARLLASRGLKSIVWTSFEKTAESIVEQLADVGAIFIPGRNSAEEKPDDAPNEKVSHFRNDKQCFVMVACSAASLKGTDLHSTCRHAVFLDRSYNVTRYLQSLRCICEAETATVRPSTAHLLIGSESIDEQIRIRLEAKIAAAIR